MFFALAVLALVAPASAGAEEARSFFARVALVAGAAGSLAGIVLVARRRRAFLRFLLGRLAWMSVTLLGITLVTFVILRLAPGDPVLTASAIRASSAEGIDTTGLSQHVGRAQKELLGILRRHQYELIAEDPDGDPLELEIDWADGTPLEKIGRGGAFASGERVLVEHAWSAPGDYAVRARAIDSRGAVSAWSEPLFVRAREPGSPLPPPVSRVAAPGELAPGVAAEFRIDVDGGGDELAVAVDKGDGLGALVVPRSTAGGWRRDLAWRAPGVFDLRARTIAADGAASPWSQPTTIVVLAPNASITPPAIELPRSGTVGAPLVVRARSAARPALDEAGLELRLRITRPSGAVEETPLRSARSGEWLSFETTFEEAGSHRVAVVATHRAVPGESEVSPEASIDIDSKNRVPVTPLRPVGESEARVETTTLEQYATWLGRIVRLDFGESLRFQRDVWSVIWEERLPKTLSLGFFSLLLTYLLAVPIGIYAATRARSFTQKGVSALLFVLYSLPSFWVATMLIVLVVGIPQIAVHHLHCDDPSVHEVGPGFLVPAFALATAIGLASATTRLIGARSLGRGGSSLVFAVVVASLAAALIAWTPRSAASAWALAIAGTGAAGLAAALGALGDSGDGRWGAAFARRAVLLAGVFAFIAWSVERDYFWHALLPVTCLTYGNLAALSRYARSGMLEVLSQDYVRTARAKGLSERAVVYSHALRNGVLPLVTIFANVFPSLITGSVIVETIFTIDGTGQLLVESILNRDYNVIMAMTTLTAVLTLAGYLVSDILYVILDPRVSFDGGARVR